jgi:hypothetical protein
VLLGGSALFTLAPPANPLERGGKMGTSKKYLLIAAVSLVVTGRGVAVPGVDDFTAIPFSDAAYLDRTTPFEITEPDFTVITELTAGDCTLTFAPGVEVGTMPDRRFLYSQDATSIEMTLSENCAAGTFGFESQPDLFDTAVLMTAAYEGDEPLGTISLTVLGRSGPRLFAADSDPPISRVVFSAESAFLVSRIRFALPGL